MKTSYLSARADRSISDILSFISESDMFISENFQFISDISDFIIDPPSFISESPLLWMKRHNQRGEYNYPFCLFSRKLSDFFLSPCCTPIPYAPLNSNLQQKDRHDISASTYFCLSVKSLFIYTNICSIIRANKVG